MKSFFIIGLLAHLLPATLLAQSDSLLLVRGKVSTSKGQPLTGAVVGVANTTKGTTTDQNGFYLLSNIPKTASLFFVYTGYKSTVKSLADEKESLDQLVVNATLELDRTLLPPMAATADYKAVKPNKLMPPRATLPESATQTGVPVEQQAYFPTGVPGLMHYVAHNLKYPVQARSAGVQGDVMVEFTVMPTGSIGHVTISQGLHPACDREALRLVQQMPPWEPARHSGQPVASVWLLPVRFAVE
ncbi:TonB family protein [Spirosoma sp. KUDC1026]|uniref:TonB family protein n=1 Tax=Spirosoma sp. KUDC1026 TaxID=2745947 RepID=UPI00159BEBB5|nr:TonB family protein [Spirosoma sp. KUDC1026]QKZ13180.1 TonB family protein [Spirosoma sp. KUDC1026]